MTALNIEKIPELVKLLRKYIDDIKSSKPDVPARIEGFYELVEALEAVEVEK